MNDIDINAADERSHELRIVSTIDRYTLAGVLGITAAVAWRCDPELERRRVEAEVSRAAYEAALGECQRWTP
jgi:hypothetical protein